MLLPSANGFAVGNGVVAQTVPRLVIVSFPLLSIVAPRSAVFAVILVTVGDDNGGTTGIVLVVVWLLVAGEVCR